MLVLVIRSRRIGSGDRNFFFRKSYFRGHTVSARTSNVRDNDKRDTADPLITEAAVCPYGFSHQGFVRSDRRRRCYCVTDFGPPTDDGTTSVRRGRGRNNGFIGHGL